MLYSRRDTCGILLDGVVLVLDGLEKMSPETDWTLWRGWSLCDDNVILVVGGEFVLVKLCIDGMGQPGDGGRVTVRREDIVME